MCTVLRDRSARDHAQISRRPLRIVAQAPRQPRTIPQWLATCLSISEPRKEPAMFTRILFPVDFSERSRGAAHAARALAQRFRSEIIALHVTPDADPAAMEDAENKLH